MKYFETKIVRTWEPSNWLRILGSILLLASAGIVFVWDPEIAWIKTLGYIVYIITFIFSMSTSFIRPKDIGMVSISEDKIKVEYKGNKASFQISELKELGLNDRGYASYWKHSLQSNKNHLYFTDGLNDLYDFEIIIQNKEKKDDLKQFLKDLKSSSSLKVERNGISSFNS